MNFFTHFKSVKYFDKIFTEKTSKNHLDIFQNFVCFQLQLELQEYLNV